MELARSTRSVEKDANSNHTTRNSGTGFSTGRGRRGNTYYWGATLYEGGVFACGNYRCKGTTV